MAEARLDRETDPAVLLSELAEHLWPVFESTPGGVYLYLDAEHKMSIRSVMSAWHACSAARSRSGAESRTSKRASSPRKTGGSTATPTAASSMTLRDQPPTASKGGAKTDPSSLSRARTHRSPSAASTDLRVAS